MDVATPQGENNTEEPSRRMARSGAGNMATGSTADLFPRLVAMQRQCAADGFAILSAKEKTLLAVGKLDISVKSPGCEILSEPLLKTQGDFLLKHLETSPRPLVYTDKPMLKPSPAMIRTPTAEGRTDLLLPVNLGAMGNGFVGFFGVRADVDNELLVDLHRKALSIMRETLRLAFGVTPVTEKLNEREIECLQLVGNGMKSEAIGERLNLSVHTVNAYLGSATTKLDSVNRIQAIAKAIRLGIIA